jgi:hypothetical protein
LTRVESLKVRPVSTPGSIIAVRQIEKASPCSKTDALEGAQAFRARTGLYRHSNQSLFASENSAGKKFIEARHRGGIFGATRRFRAPETALSRVTGGKATEG